MLEIFPFLVWLATVASAVLLAVLWKSGELRPGTLGLLLGWFLVAGYCQFFASSALVSAIGRALQTILAIFLILRWRWTA